MYISQFVHITCNYYDALEEVNGISMQLERCLSTTCDQNSTKTLMQGVELPVGVSLYFP